jgi:hypothetical protein
MTADFKPSSRSKGAPRRKRAVAQKRKLYSMFKCLFRCHLINPSQLHLHHSRTETRCDTWTREEREWSMHSSKEGGLP